MKLLIIIIFSLLSFFGNSQTYIAGQVYYGLDNYIEYQAGNLPIILSSAHGGYLSPSSLPDRVCSGCVTGRDSYTQELTRSIASEIYNLTGCYPHVIINKLHRKKLDANREIIEATDSNSITEPYWHDFMNFIDSAKNEVLLQYSKGLFLDIHGHGHTIQRLELGYLLSSTDLRKSDSALNSLPINNKSSLLNLRLSNLHAHTHAQLIRGYHSFGAMIQRKGIPAVPSDSIAFPLVGEPYFNGGYNTRRFGSSNGGTVDAIQIESHQGVRFDSLTRENYADSLAKTILDYLDYHYFIDFSNGYCNSNSFLVSHLAKNIDIYPNPANTKISIQGLNSIYEYQLINIQGKIVQNGNIKPNESIDITTLKNGIYILKLNFKKTTFTKKVIKQ